MQVNLQPLNRTYMGNIILDEAVRHSRVAEIFDNLLDNVKKLGVGYRSLLCS